MQEENSTFNSLIQKLAGKNIIVTEHEPVRTSEEAAAIRGTSLESGAKAMLLCTSGIMVLAVMSASRKLDWKLMKKIVGVREIRFATEEEVNSRTRCIPGAVPPFGSLWGIQTYMDNSLQLQGTTINFNAGLRTKSVSMSLEDYLEVERPIVGNFTKA
ncbi:unnamed protein product [Blepharisma stoltei]|uniref:YbaK/aminoacyl-tRNA synthetase-associated domain-containing protein n=1 Tax=Blepharisma stoltei TaxID=1481888 RepID=A0AAU9IZJ0_9CILI|nr:unnamed protein product [Blepharisma stoltei]